jgi:transposase
MQKFTIRDFQAKYPDDEACLKTILDRKYPDWQCDCGRIKLYKIKNRSSYACACGFQLNPLTGTVFANTKLPLTSWFYVIYVMTQTKSGVSATTIQRHLGVKYDTAWRMMMKVREMMVDDTPLEGEIEADETYLRAKPWRTTRPLAYNGRAQTVFGIVERGGRAKAFAIPTNSKHFLLEKIEEHARPTVMYTDGYQAYQDLALKYPHYTVHHSKKEFVNGHIHTQNIENVWSHIKRGIYGVYRSVHPEYLQHYLDEYTWRYSKRFSSEPLFYELLKGL